MNSRESRPQRGAWLSPAHSCSADARRAAPDETRAAGRQPTAIITANGSEPQNPLIPANTNETGGGKIIDSIFAGLVYYDADGRRQNDVAESIETDDNDVYTIKIKDGQKFTNGEDVTASSFVDAWDWTRRSRATRASTATSSSDIEGFSYDEDDSLKDLGGLDGRRRLHVHGRS